jgi:hypothetical protein
MQTITLSVAALALLRRRLASERVEVSDENRPLYHELVAAGLMMPLHTFALGRDSAFRLTDAACDLRDGPSGLASPVPSSYGAPGFGRGHARPSGRPVCRGPSWSARPRCLNLPRIGG